jgi:uncharacterized protein with beta-barrel porin domain
MANSQKADESDNSVMAGGGIGKAAVALALMLAGILTIAMPPPGFAQVNGGDSGGVGAGGGGGFGGGSGGSGHGVPGGDGGNGVGGAGSASSGGGGAGVGGGGAGGPGLFLDGLAGSGTIGALTNTGTISGGAGSFEGGGGAGIGGGGADAGGGRGGDAGFTITNSTVNNSGTISGGAGGPGGGAGDGGDGIGNGGSIGGSLSGGAGLNNLTIINSGAISGGAGGAASGPHSPLPGTGGAGISGSGMTVVNSGTISGGLDGAGVTQANAITFTGGTNVLQLQAGSTISGNVVAFSTADTFQLGGMANSSFDVSQIGPAAQYQGFGVFQKNGSSTWTLTGTNTATLPWSINAGTLLVNGALANSTMTVNSSATLGGTGTVGATAVNAGGSFAPGGGTPGSSMTVNGSLALASGALYVVAINPSAASFATVAGTATLGGATVNAVFANGSYVTRQYTILTATAGVSGTFASVANTNLPSNFAETLSYDHNDAYLNLNLTFGIPNSLNRNQQAVGNALTNFFNTTGGIPMAFGALTPASLTQASGELGTGSQQTTFDAMNQFMGVMTDPFMNRSGGAPSPPGASGYAEEGDASAYAATRKTDAFAMFTKAPPVAFEQRWSVWTAGFGGSQNTDGNAATGSNNTTSSVYGTAVGADYLFSPNTIAGFALAGGGTNFSVVNSGSGHSDLFQAGAYLRHTEGAAYISAALAYGWQDITTNRTVSAAGLDQLRAEFNANAYSGRLEGGYRFVAPWTGGIGITPYAAGQFTTFDLPSYAEQVLSGAGTFALAYGAKDVTDVRGELGFRTDKSFVVQDGILTLRTRFGWAHDFDPDRSIATTFQALPGASFVVNGAAQASDSALTTASIEMKWRNGWSAAATFEGEFSDVTSSYAGKGVLRYAW